MDFIFEILMEIYMELMLLIVPEKNITKMHRGIVMILTVLEFVVMIALVFWGVVLIADCRNLLGWIPIAFVILISLFQIIAGIVLYKKHH